MQALTDWLQSFINTGAGFSSIGCKDSTKLID
jgi:hypothetical protein